MAYIALTVIVAMVAGVLFASNAFIIGRAGAPGPARSGFVIAWAALGCVIVTDALRHALGLAPEPSAAAYSALVWVKVFVTGAAIAGFGTYIGYVWTGSDKAIWTAVAVGTFHTGVWLVLTSAATPGDVVVGDWGTRMHYAPTPFELEPTWLGPAAFFGPLLLLALLYVAFFPKVPTRGHRFRLGMAATSLLVFLAASLVQGDPGVDPDRPTLFLNMLLVLIAASASRLAFAPPASWAKYGIKAYGQ